MTQIAKGAADPDSFMRGIEEMGRVLVETYPILNDGKKDLFAEEKTAIGKCPRYGGNVYEGKKNYYCSEKDCAFVMWKNDRFFEERKIAFTPKITAALLADCKAKVKKLYSPKTGKTYDGTVLLADTGGKYVNYRIEIQREKELTQQAYACYETFSLNPYNNGTSLFANFHKEKTLQSSKRLQRFSMSI